MIIITNSTFKSVSASIGLHALFIVLGSWVFYNNSTHTLELGGNGGGMKSISLSSINFNVKKSTSNKAAIKKISTTVSTSTSATNDGVSVPNGVVSAAVMGGEQGGVGQKNNFGSGSGVGEGAGTEDFDHGLLFGQIKKFFETRLGAVLNIREKQLIKIKVTLDKEGEIQDAMIIQGQFEMSVARRIISVAKSIPLKSYWNSTTYPKELIIPLVFTPS